METLLDETRQAVHVQQLSYYERTYQPAYSDPEAVKAAKDELKTMKGVATFEEIDNVLAESARIAEGISNAMIVEAGGCTEPVNMQISEEYLAAKNLKILSTTVDVAGKSFKKLRALGQSFKPRSKQYEKVQAKTADTETEVPSHYGDGINGHEIESREPDPSRMVATAIQARDLRSLLVRELGEAPITSHEALLIYYEESFLRESVSGELYLLSCHTPWIGKRTNSIGSLQVELLKDIKNPISIKIGPDTTPQEIEQLAKTLNPMDIPGKLTFIFRLGADRIEEKLPPQLEAVKAYASKSLRICDPMHGNTIQKNGLKTRVLTTMTKEMRAFTKLCNEQGLRSHGYHLEASGEDNPEECIDSLGDSPRDKATIDPELNNRQLKNILTEAKQIHEQQRVLC